MLTKEQLEKTLSKHPLVQPRLDTLRVATELNPQFRNPHIAGGYLRNIALGANPNDCDVIFQGYMLNQPGIVEAVRGAEAKLGIEPYPEWDFENSAATGLSGDFYEDNIGRYSHHTDYLTMLLMDTDGNLFVGEDQKTLSDIENRVYDLRFSGIEIWAKHRGNGRSYVSCLVGDLLRGMYLSNCLDLTPSITAAFFMSNFDHFFNQLDSNDQQSRINYWKKKTKGDPNYQKILLRFRINSLQLYEQSFRYIKPNYTKLNRSI